MNRVSHPSGALVAARDGGYDDNYKVSRQVWGTGPGRLLEMLFQRQDMAGRAVLDLGCGQGRNSYHLAARGAHVTALDVSEIAITEARRTYGDHTIRWSVDDATRTLTLDRTYDCVIAYGLLHCLEEYEVDVMMDRLQRATKPGGYNVIVTFNARRQELLLAHPGFHPTLKNHAYFLERYGSPEWAIEYATDEDLEEEHPNNGIRHVHSMTRLLARMANRDD